MTIITYRPFANLSPMCTHMIVNFLFVFLFKQHNETAFRRSAGPVSGVDQAEAGGHVADGAGCQDVGVSLCRFEGGTSVSVSVCFFRVVQVWRTNNLLDSYNARLVLIHFRDHVHGCFLFFLHYFYAGAPAVNR